MKTLMVPVIALVGRPNVGKSTLFNCLTRTRDALVADRPGLTRDRQYGMARLGQDGRPYMVVDTGGLSDDPEGIETLMEGQVWLAVEEADAVLFIVDGRGGLTAADEEIANRLRMLGKPVHLVVNKTEGLEAHLAASEFYATALGEPFAISAAHNQRVFSLMEHVLEDFPVSEEESENGVEDEESGVVRVAVLGRPNVGKSTLINRLIGEDRLLAFDMPGTTRDTIEVPFEENGQDYLLVDTAGIRRRAKISDSIEKFSVIKAFQAIERANVVILVLDAQEGMTDQDATLLGMVMDQGRALVIAFNKWDGMSPEDREWNRSELGRRLHFIDYVDIHNISALHGSNIRPLFESVTVAYDASVREMKTPDLNRILEDCIASHPPPSVQGRRIKMRYAHQGGKNPPKIVIHGNQLDSVPKAYRRYLEKKFRESFDLYGTPVQIAFKTGSNPYAGKQNKLTARQINKKQRLQKFVKRKKK